MRILIYVTSFFFGIAGLMIAFWYVLRSGKVVKGVYIGWGLSIVCIFLVSIVFPAIAAIYDREYCKYFPEAIGVPVVIFAGLIPALVVATVAGLIRELMKRWRKSNKEGNGLECSGGERYSSSERQ